MTSPLHCDRIGCDQPGRWLPVLELRADRRRGYHLPAPVIIGLAICDGHKADATVADFVSDEGWAQLAGAFRRIGKAEPDRARVVVSWMGADSSDPTIREFVARIAERQAP